MFDIPSKAELNEKQSEYASVPLEPGNYIVRIGAIRIRKVPSFVEKKPMYDKPEVAFEILCLPVQMESGDSLMNIEGKEVKPFTEWIFRNANPFSIGFQQDKVTPSIMRGFLAAATGVGVNDRISSTTFVLMDKNLNEVTDQSLRQRYEAEVTAYKVSQVPSQMISEGYRAFPDIREFVGKYVGATVQLKTNGDKSSNAISLFNKVPRSFTAPVGVEEAMEKFSASYEKFLAKSLENDAKKFGSSVPQATQPQGAIAQPPVHSMSDEVIVDDTLKIDEVVF